MNKFFLITVIVGGTSFFCLQPVGRGGSVGRPAPGSQIAQQIDIPGPLFGFGQNILNQNQFVVTNYFEAVEGFNDEFWAWDPGVLYGVTDRASLLVQIPILSAHSHLDRSRLIGLGDIIIQGEYALYSQIGEDVRNQMTGIAAFIAPTAKVGVAGALDRPTSGFFLGSTVSHTSLRSYVYGATGLLMSLKKNSVDYGNIFLFEMGLGLPIWYTDKSFLSILFEFNGRYSSKDRVNDQLMINGGARAFFGPILHWVYKTFTFQIGFQQVVMQRRFGQDPLDYRVGFFFSF